MKKTLPIIIALCLLIASAFQAHATPKEISESFVEVNDVRLHYVEMGKGPLVILLHGWPETSASWHDVMVDLSKDFRVVAPDLRGTGLSEKTVSGYDKKTIATDIKSLIEHLGEKKAYVIGHDMGGKAAYTMAHLYPEKIIKLILADCLIPGTENMDSLRGGAWHYGFHMAKDIPEMLTKGREKEYIEAQIKNWSHKKDAISDKKITEYASYYAAQGGMTAGFNYYRALKDDAAIAKDFKGKKLAMPVLTITGEYGAANKLADALKSEAPDLTSVVIKDSGHFVAEETPKTFIKSVRAFLSQK